MLAAEHTEQPGAELCPQCRRFPLDVDAPLDLSQWDYVEPDFKDALESDNLASPAFTEPLPGPALKSLENLEPENLDEEIPEDAYDEIEERVRTCYHCYQAESELAERCPVCGDSYLPPALREPHRA